MSVPYPNEKRITARGKSKIRVWLKFGKQTAVCEGVNVSTGGMGLKGVGLGLKRYDPVELRVALLLSNGVTRIHRRAGSVMHVTAGTTGVVFSSVSSYPSSS